MTRMPLRIVTLLAATMAAWQPSIARAAEEDDQFWLLGFARGNLDEDVFIVIDTSLRVREDQVGPDQQTIRVTVEQGLADNRLRLGGGVAIFETDGQTELRPHQQFRYVRGGLDLRTRFEQRLFPGADQAELRIRQRAQYTQGLKDDLDIIGSVEWFGLVQARDPGRQTGTEQVRFIVSLEQDIGKRLSIQPGYLFWYGVREGREDSISHVAQLALNYRF